MRQVILWLVVLVVMAGLAQAGETSGRLRLQLAHEFDTNAQRVSTPLVSDNLLRLVLEGLVRHVSGSQQFMANYLGGLKLFYNQDSESLVATKVTCAYRYVGSDAWLLGARLTFRDSTLQDHDRDYSLWLSEVFYQRRLLPWLFLHVRLGGRYFWFKPDDHKDQLLKLSHLGPLAELRFMMKLGQALGATAFYQTELRFFKHQVMQKERLDLRHLSGLQVQYQFHYAGDRRMVLDMSYFLAVNDSNNRGSSAMWHRLRLMASLQLPLDMILHVMGTLQFTEYSDGIYVEGDLYEPEADENENSLVVRLSCPLWGGLSAVLHGGFYRNDFHSSSVYVPPFRRETLMLGLAYDLPF